MRYLFDLHYFGPAALTKAALPHMRRQGSGWVVQFSSVGGQFTAPGFGAYCATKFALEGLTQTLSEEVPHVRFLIVEPGAFRTGLFGKDAAYLSSPMPEYAETVGTDSRLRPDRRRLSARRPVKAARAILTAMSSAKPPLRLVLGEDAIDRIRQRLGHLQDELTEWEELGRDTALDE
jgi:NAD(P)-dependent dehydrogenase (short-subunit alcohol dehydrogenase family)